MAKSNHGRAAAPVNPDPDGDSCLDHKAKPKLRVERYGDSRYWAIYLDDELLAVTVYKKGAVAVGEALGKTR